MSKWMRWCIFSFKYVKFGISRIPAWLRLEASFTTIASACNKFFDMMNQYG